MKILVTGGYGFIGSALIRMLLSSTDHKVLNIDKLTYASNIKSIPEDLISSNYNFKQIDICDKNKVKNAINEFQPSIIMHLAAESHVDRSIEGPEIFLKTNILGTYNLLAESLNYYKTLKGSDKKNFRFHHVSTDEVFGDLNKEDKPFSEESLYKPSSPYSASKASSDHLVRAWNKTYKLPTLISNCSNNFGPYHFPEKFIPHIIISAILGKHLPIYGNGMQIRDWLHVNDHVDALFKIATEGESGQTYLIGGNSERTNIDVVFNICSYLDKRLPNNIGKDSYKDLIKYVEDRPGHDKRYAINAKKIKDELAWSPSIKFEDGIKNTVDWYLDNDKWWKSIINKKYELKRMGGNEQI